MPTGETVAVPAGLVTDLVVMVPEEWTDEDAAAEITMLALVLLRDVRTLWLVSRGGYEWQIEGTEEVATAYIDWLLSLPEEEWAEAFRGWKPAADALTLAGAVPDWMRTHWRQVLAHGQAFLRAREERSDVAWIANMVAQMQQWRAEAAEKGVTDGWQP